MYPRLTVDTQGTLARNTTAFKGVSTIDRFSAFSHNCLLIPGIAFRAPTLSVSPNSHLILRGN